MAKSISIVEERKMKSVQLKNALLEYAWNQFTTCGIKQVKVDDIAHHFSISKRTLYEMFTDKEQLVLECFILMGEKSEAMLTNLKNEVSNSLELFVKFFTERITALKKVDHQFFVDAVKYPSLNLYIEQTQERRTKMLLNIIERCVNEGYLVKQFNYTALFEAYSKQMVNVIKYKMFNEKDLPDLMIMMNVIAFRGCCTYKGIQLLDKLLLDYFKSWNTNR